MIKSYSKINCGLAPDVSSYAQVRHLRTKTTIKYSAQNAISQARGYKTFFVLNSAEHKIYPAHKC